MVGAPTKLAGIQLLRLVAAVAVLTQHAYYLNVIRRGEASAWFLSLGVSTWGVWLFFVISGFVIAKVADDHPVRFALHRVARIYPPLLAAFAIAIPLMLAFGDITWSAARFSPTMLILAWGDGLANWAAVPYWTLLYEMTFYLVTFWLLLIGGLRAFDIGLAAWAIMVAIVYLTGNGPPAASTNIVGLLTSNLDLLFICGASLHRWMRGSRLPAAGAVVGVLAVWWPSSTGSLICLLAIATMAAAIWAGTFPLSDSRAVRWLSCGGDYSYGLYLMHFSVIYVLGIQLADVERVGVAEMVAIGGIVGGLAGLLFGWVEFTFYVRFARPMAERLVGRYRRVSVAVRKPEVPLPSSNPGVTGAKRVVDIA